MWKTKRIPIPRACACSMHARASALACGVSSLAYNLKLEARNSDVGAVKKLPRAVLLSALKPLASAQEPFETLSKFISKPFGWCQSDSSPDVRAGLYFLDSNLNDPS